MGKEKLTRYQQNARPGPLQPGSRPISAIYRKVSGMDLPKGYVSLAVCAFVKRRHIYYKKTSLLVPEDGNIEKAEDSLKAYINYHPELKDVHSDKDDAFNDDLFLDDKRLEEEEIELLKEDDSDEYNKKKKFYYDPTLSFSKFIMLDKYPKYVPEAAYESLDFAGKHDQKYQDNLLAFYKYKHDGTFNDKGEDASVLISNGKIKAYGETKWDSSSFPVLSDEEKRSYLWRCIKDEPFIIKQKKQVTKVEATGNTSQQYKLSVKMPIY